MDKMIKEIDYIYTLQEITDIVDKLFSPDDYILDESGRYILGIRNIEESRKRIYITKLLLKLRDINEKIKNGDFNIGYRYTYEEIQNMKDDRQKIYNTLCKELNISVKEEENLQSIMTENEKKYFTKAIDAGLMEEVENGYEWLHNKGMKASLGYFLHKVFNPNGTARIPYRFVESLFNESRLDRAIDQALIVKQPQKWRKEIDTLFDD